MAKLAYISGKAADGNSYVFRAKKAAYDGVKATIGFTVGDKPPTDAKILSLINNKASAVFPRVRCTLENGKTRVIFCGADKLKDIVKQLKGKSIGSQKIGRASIVNN